jgi:hypothetical protein
MAPQSDELIDDLVFGRRPDVDAEWLDIDRHGRAAPLQGSTA